MKFKQQQTLKADHRSSKSNDTSSSSEDDKNQHPDIGLGGKKRNQFQTEEATLKSLFKSKFSVINQSIMNTNQRVPISSTKSGIQITDRSAFRKARRRSLFTTVSKDFGIRPQHNFVKMASMKTQRTEPAPFSEDAQKYDKIWRKQHEMLVNRVMQKYSGRQSRVYDCMTISTANGVLQAWFLFVILLSFFSSFHYAYMATYLTELDEEKQNSIIRLTFVYELFFFVDILLNLLFVERHYTTPQQGNKTVERDFRAICVLYMKEDACLDMIAIVPFHTIFKQAGAHHEYLRLFFGIKLVRLIVGYKLLNYRSFMRHLKQFFKQRLKNLIRSNHQLAESQEKDLTNITLIVLISKILKTTQMITVLLCISYFTGLIWYIYSDFSERQTSAPFENMVFDDQQEYFNSAYSLAEKSHAARVLTLTYFTFTSLTTVGFGDFHPKSNSERLLGAFFLLIGVSLTSYIMDNLNQIMQSLAAFNKSFDDSKSLNKFFKTLKRFNGNVSIPLDNQEEIEEYFEFRWSEDRNMAISTQEDMDLVEQLPKMVQNRIYTEFLFKGFILQYSRLFRVMKSTAPLQSYFTNMSKLSFDKTHHDQNDRFMDFLAGILKYLEPKRVVQNQILQKQQETVDEIVFMMKGDFIVGYNNEHFLYTNGISDVNELLRVNIKHSMLEQKPNRQLTRKITQFFSKQTSSDVEKRRKFHYPLMFKPGQNIGLFEMFFEKESSFLYKTGSLGNRKETCECFFIRKQNWKIIKKDAEQLVIDQFGKKILIDYLTRIYLPIQEYQSKIMGKYKKTHHQDGGSMSLDIESPMQMKIQYPSDEEIGGQSKILQELKKAKMDQKLHKGGHEISDDEDSLREKDEILEASSDKEESMNVDQSQNIDQHEGISGGLPENGQSISVHDASEREQLNKAMDSKRDEPPSLSKFHARKKTLKKLQTQELKNRLMAQSDEVSNKMADSRLFKSPKNVQAQATLKRSSTSHDVHTNMKHESLKVINQIWSDQVAHTRKKKKRNSVLSELDKVLDNHMSQQLQRIWKSDIQDDEMKELVTLQLNYIRLTKTFTNKNMRSSTLGLHKLDLSKLRKITGSQVISEEAANALNGEEQAKHIVECLEHGEYVEILKKKLKEVLDSIQRIVKENKSLKQELVQEREMVRKLNGQLQAIEDERGQINHYLSDCGSQRVQLSKQVEDSRIRINESEEEKESLSRGSMNELSRLDIESGLDSKNSESNDNLFRGDLQVPGTADIAHMQSHSANQLQVFKEISELVPVQPSAPDCQRTVKGSSSDEDRFEEEEKKEDNFILHNLEDRKWGDMSNAQPIPVSASLTSDKDSGDYRHLNTPKINLIPLQVQPQNTQMEPNIVSQASLQLPQTQYTMRVMRPSSVYSQNLDVVEQESNFEVTSNYSQKSKASEFKPMMKLKIHDKQREQKEKRRQSQREATPQGGMKDTSFASIVGTSFVQVQKEQITSQSASSVTHTIGGQQRLNFGSTGGGTGGAAAVSHFSKPSSNLQSYKFQEQKIHFNAAPETPKVQEQRAPKDEDSMKLGVFSRQNSKRMQPRMKQSKGDLFARTTPKTPGEIPEEIKSSIMSGEDVEAKPVQGRMSSHHLHLVSQHLVGTPHSALQTPTSMPAERRQSIQSSASQQRRIQRVVDLKLKRKSKYLD